MLLRIRNNQVIIDKNNFIIYLDITKLYPIRTEYIDSLAFIKIYLLIQLEPATTWTPASGSVSMNLDSLAAVIKQ